MQQHQRLSSYCRFPFLPNSWSAWWPHNQRLNWDLVCGGGAWFSRVNKCQHHYVCRSSRGCFKFHNSRIYKFNHSLDGTPALFVRYVAQATRLSCHTISCKVHMLSVLSTLWHFLPVCQITRFQSCAIILTEPSVEGFFFLGLAHFCTTDSIWLCCTPRHPLLFHTHPSIMLLCAEWVVRSNWQPFEAKKCHQEEGLSCSEY